MNTFHFFRYRYPKLKLKIVHETLEAQEWMDVDIINVPRVGDYIFDPLRNRWHQKKQKQGGSRPYYHEELQPNQVPAEFRTYLLLVL